MAGIEGQDTGQADDAQASTRTSFPGLFSRRSWAGVLALLLSLGFTFMNAPSASALLSGDIIKTDLLRNWATGLCLDSNSNGAVYTNPCQQGNAYQTWSVVYHAHIDYDIVRFRNQATGLCLFWGNLDGARYPYTSSCTPGAAAWNLNTWLGVGTSWDQVQLVNRTEGMCLDSNSAGNAYMLGCNGGGYQKWKVGF